MLFKGIEPDGHIAKMLTVPEERCYSTSSDESNTSFQVKKEKNSEAEKSTEIESKSEEVTVHVEIKVSRKRMLSSPGSKSPSKKICLDEGGGNATSGDSSEKYFKAITTKKSNDKNEKKCIKDLQCNVGPYTTMLNTTSVRLSFCALPGKYMVSTLQANFPLYSHNILLHC